MLIPISETLHHQLSEQAREELRQELVKEQKALATKEREFKKREEELVEKEQAFDQRVEERIAVEKSRLAKEAARKVRDEVAIELKELREAGAEMPCPPKSGPVEM